MRYEYTFRNTPGDYWKFRMENHYRNWTGLVSIVYTLSMLALTIAKWNSTNGLGKALLLIFLLVAEWRYSGDRCSWWSRTRCTPTG